MIDRIGDARLPVLDPHQERMWNLIFAVAGGLPPEKWALVGGQMVWLHAVQAGVMWPRTTRDIDMLANMELLTGNLHSCARALRDQGLRVRLDSNGFAYRFIDAEEEHAASLQVDLLAPDHIKDQAKLRMQGGKAVQIPGGTQALQRVGIMNVHLATGESAVVPVPGLLGAIVLKAAAWAVDARERERHAQDAALLVSLIDDASVLRAQLRGKDRGRLQRLDSELMHASAQPWLLLGDAGAEVGHGNWQELIRPPR